MTPEASFGPALLEWSFFPPPFLGRVCWSTSLSPRRFDFDSFSSKTNKVCALPPIFEILPVKSLKARNQTLAPPFPELRYLSLAYNKVTLGFSTSFPRSRWEGGVWIALAWKPTLPFPASAECRFRNSQGGGSQGWGNRRQAGRERSHSIQSQVLIYHSPCSRLCAGHWGYNCMKRFDLCPYRACHLQGRLRSNK